MCPHVLSLFVSLSLSLSLVLALLLTTRRLCLTLRVLASVFVIAWRDVGRKHVQNRARSTRAQRYVSSRPLPLWLALSPVLAPLLTTRRVYLILRGKG